jgi:hypothetical protein
MNKLFLKMRFPRYVLTAKDLEDRTSRAALGELVDAIGAAVLGEIPQAQTGLLRLTGSLDSARLAAYRAQLDTAPLGSPVPWIVLAALLPETITANGLSDASLGAYRRALVGAFEGLASLPLEEFHRVLTARANPDLDAKLGAVKDVLRSALEANAGVATPTGA